MALRREHTAQLPRPSSAVKLRRIKHCSNKTMQRESYALLWNNKRLMKQRKQITNSIYSQLHNNNFIHIDIYITLHYKLRNSKNVKQRQKVLLKSIQDFLRNPANKPANRQGWKQNLLRRDNYNVVTILHLWTLFTTYRTVLFTIAMCHHSETFSYGTQTPVRSNKQS